MTDWLLHEIGHIHNSQRRSETIVCYLNFQERERWNERNWNWNNSRSLEKYGCAVWNIPLDLSSFGGIKRIFGIDQESECACVGSGTRKILSSQFIYGHDVDSELICLHLNSLFGGSLVRLIRSNGIFIANGQTKSKIIIIDSPRWFWPFSVRCLCDLNWKPNELRLHFFCRVTMTVNPKQ